MTRPHSSEYAPYYAKYIDLVAEGDYLTLLDENTSETLDFFKNIDVAKHEYRYAEGKWTIKDVLLHIVDTERGFSYRAIMCVRGDDKTPLFGMDEDLFAANADTSLRTMDNLLQEFLAVRQSFRMIFSTNPVEKMELWGNNAGHKITARALGYLGIGHTLHHTNIVKERYL
jgi:uncharacterized damage-inducible protein DinB